MEEWINIDDNYSVSNMGRVYSKPRLGTKGGIVGSYNKSLGYDVVCMYRKVEKIYVLVAKAFCNWFEGCNIHHINENKRDNRAENLVCIPPNEHHKIHNSERVLTQETKTKISESLKKSQKLKKKTILQLSENGDILKEWSSIIECCKELNLSVAGLSNYFCRNKTDIVNYKGFILKKLPPISSC